MLEAGWQDAMDELWVVAVEPDIARCVLSHVWTYEWMDGWMDGHGVVFESLMTMKKRKQPTD